MLHVFIPCKDYSSRFPEKNFKPFRGSSSLLFHKLKQVSLIPEVMDIWVSGNRGVEREAALFEKTERRIIHSVWQPQNLSGEELVQHMLDVFQDHPDDDTILWTQVTNPLFDKYNDAFVLYNTVQPLGGLVSVTPIQSFVVDEDCAPINYEGGWPRTQDIEPLYVINSALFMFQLGTARKYKNKYGPWPYLYKVNEFEGLDIDWKYQYDAAVKLT